MRGSVSTKISAIAKDSKINPRTAPFSKYAFPVIHLEANPEITPRRTVETEQGKAVKPPTDYLWIPPIKPASNPEMGPPATPAIIDANSLTLTIAPLVSVPISVP